MDKRTYNKIAELYDKSPEKLWMVVSGMLGLPEVEFISTNKKEAEDYSKKYSTPRMGLVVIDGKEYKDAWEEEEPGVSGKEFIDFLQREIEGTDSITIGKIFSESTKLFSEGKLNNSDLSNIINSVTK